MLEGTELQASHLDIEKIQAAVTANFALINKEMGEIGTCKKMVNLGCLKPEWQHLAVVYAKEATAFSKAMVEKEHTLLKHLEKQGYPSVKVWGNAFTVQTTASGERLGMIETYIPGTFIEAKTPAPLNLLITSALLALPARSQEAWLIFNRTNLTSNITKALADTDTFRTFQERAIRLGNAFQALRAQLIDKQEKIHDLQMIISADGSLTVIDPLDVMTDLHGIYQSLLEKERLTNPSLVSFVQKTDTWLLQAQQFCQQLLKCKSASEVLEYCSLNQQQPLIFSSIPGDHAGKSRLSQLKRLSSTLAPPQKSTAKQKI